MVFGDPVWLNAFLLVPAVAIVPAWSMYAQRRAIRRFLGTRRRSPVRWFVRSLRAALIVVALAGLFGALARPQWNPESREVTRSGRDLAFVVDVSRSMLAEDLAPNRLDRAKLWIKDLVATLEGDRVALVAFAGGTVVKCPLTHDYGFFTMALDELATDSVARGGTNIGDAIRRTMREVFADDEERFRDIILITDGEDQGSLPIRAAEAAGQSGIRIIAIGIGSDDDGALIPVTDDAGRRENLTHQGETVRTKLDSSTLSRVARASEGGVFLNVSTGTISLDQIYRDLIASADQNESETVTIMEYEEGFQIVLAGVLALLLLEGWLNDRRRP